MANKYFLIPKDLYDGLIKTEPENQNIDFERKLLEKTKKIGKKDVKNILYNQEMKRYLKLKKEKDNKPVRVEIAKGANLIIPPQPQTVPPQARRRRAQPRSLPASHGSMASILQQYDQQDENDGWDTPVNVRRGMSQSGRTSSSSSKASTEKTNVASPRLFEHTPSLLPKSTPRAYQYRKEPLPVQLAKSTPRTFVYSNKSHHPGLSTSTPIQNVHDHSNEFPATPLHSYNRTQNPLLAQLYNQITSNTNNFFNVTKGDQIISLKNRSTAGSNVMKTLEWLSVPNNTSTKPPGTDFLLSKIKNSPQASNLLRKAKNWGKNITSMQHGRGHIKKRTKQSHKSLFTFKPQLWK